MRIGVLTLPLHSNYGGILQAYALTSVLKEMEHEVVVINKPQYRYISPYFKYIIYVWRLFQKFILRKPNIYVFREEYYNHLQELNSYTLVNTTRFVEKYIPTRAIKRFVELNQGDFDAIVVGSDQIWRPMFIDDPLCANVEDAFLGFARRWPIKRIAYAASFGVEKWEYTPEQTLDIKPLAQLFDAISVREASGVDLCKVHLGVAAQHVLDPTMLLTSAEYDEFAQNGTCPQGKILYYILDENEQKCAIAIQIQSLLSCDIYNVQASNGVSVQPPVENWLRAFAESKYVITDSFHACVFSILYHKPFVVLRNELRGNDRINSLLEMFHLESRIVVPNKTDIESLVIQPIDYMAVDGILKSKREEAKAFLKLNLSE